MVPTVLVGSTVDDGRALVEKLVEQGASIDGAYWLYTEERGYARLYIVSKLVKELGPKEMYRRVREALSQLPGSTLSPGDTSVISPRDPFVQALRAYVNKGDRTRERRLPGLTLNNVLADDLYVYWLK
jgi:hypothetical protein